MIQNTPRLAFSETPIWSEEFGQKGLNTSLWNYDVGSGGWGNAELETYTDSTDNINVNNGELTITAIKKVTGPTEFTSGRINTNNKFAFQYARLEASIKLTDLSDGLWPAFWLLGEDFDTVGWPDCGEIDIMEMGYQDWKVEGGNGTINQSVSSAAHYKENGHYKGNTDGYYLAPQDQPIAGSDTWHNLTLSWTPQAIETFIDGNQIWYFDISDPEEKDTEEFHKPHFLVADLAVGGNYPDIHNAASITAPFPATYSIQYIRLFDNGYTAILHKSSITGAGTTVKALEIVAAVTVAVVGIVLLKKNVVSLRPTAAVTTGREHEMASLASRDPEKQATTQINKSSNRYDDL